MTRIASIAGGAARPWPRGAGDVRAQTPIGDPDDDDWVDEEEWDDDDEPSEDEDDDEEPMQLRARDRR